MKNGLNIGWLILLVLLGTGLAFSNPLSPSIHVPAPDFNFGEIEEGQTITHDYPVKNMGSATLEIKDVQPG